VTFFFDLQEHVIRFGYVKICFNSKHARKEIMMG
jgi:hypothetical protein